MDKPATTYRSSIRRKLMTIIMLVSVSVMIFACVAFISYEWLTSRKQMINNLSANAMMLAKNCTAALSFEDSNDATELLGSLQVKNPITMACVYRANGDLFAAYKRNNFDSSITSPPCLQGHNFKNGFLTIFEPIFLEGRIIGTICLQSDLSELYASLRQIIIATILMVFLLSCGAYVLSARLQKIISAPILDLAKIARGVSENEDYSVRAPMHSDDEIGTLTAAFNEMLTRIEGRDVELRKSEQKYRALFEDSRDAICLITRDGKFIDMNQSALDLFGYEREEMLGVEIKTLYVNPYDWPRFQKEIEQKGAVRDFIVNLHKKDGTLMDALFTASARRSEAGTIGGYQGIIRDITEAKRFEAQFYQAQKMEAVGTLAGGIAHDFNNFLMAIQGHTSLALLNADSKHPYHEHIVEIDASIEKAADLTRQLLSFARGGKHKTMPTDLNLLIEQNLKLFGRTKKEIKIHKKFEGRIWPVDVDRGQIEQVMLNLYVNAWQAMPGGGELYIETSNIALDEHYTNPFNIAHGEYVRISVTDTGTGMDEAVQKRIFEPFFTTKERGQGTGLGLSSAYGIIKNHSGILNVYSKKGLGSTFNIYLPVSKKVMVVEAERRHGEIIKGDGSVLIVDDELVVLEVGFEMLRELGYRPIKARSGEEALEIYKGHKDAIDLVILDMIMPGMGGGEVYNKLRELNANVKILIASGYGVAGQVMDISSDGFMQKPFDIYTLSGKIGEMLKPSKEAQNV
ncbi:MAG: PAS domain S-box protein [Pseudomonadota bacterium]